MHLDVNWLVLVTSQNNNLFVLTAGDISQCKVDLIDVTLAVEDLSFFSPEDGHTQLTSGCGVHFKCFLSIASFVPLATFIERRFLG